MPTALLGSSTTPDVVAYRGGQVMTKEELEAHVASLLCLENIGVFLGSGSSCGLGGKTIKTIWAEFKKDYRNSFDWLENEGFISSPVNIENLLDTLEIALKEWSRANRPLKVKQLLRAKNNLLRSIIKGAELARALWQSTDSDKKAELLSNHIKLLQKIISARQPGQAAPWFFTTNYDLAIEWAAENIGLHLTNGFSGLHNRVFSPQVFDLGFHNLLAKGEAKFGAYHANLVKLHGSLSWQSAKDTDEYTEISAGSAKRNIKSFIEDNDSTFDSPIIFPAAAKYIQTIGFVLSELVRRFVDFLFRPQTCIFISGYSFSDAHLDQLIIRALQNPTLQAVIFIPEAKTKTDGTLDLSLCSNTIRKVYQLQSPQVTIVGGGELAYFDKFVSLLPDPVIYDNQALQIRMMLKELKATS